MELKIKKHEQVQLNRRGQGKWPQDKSNYQSSRNLRGRGKSTS